jgi:viroplasmin and RNaseH domain-containing protein
MEIYVVIAVWRGVFDHAKAFVDLEHAKSYMEELKKAESNCMDYDVSTVSLELEA